MFLKYSSVTQSESHRVFGLIIVIYDNYAWMGYITLEQYNQGRSHSETNKAMSGEQPELLFYNISLERASQNSMRTIYLLRKVFLVIQSQYKDLTSQWFHNIFQQLHTCHKTSNIRDFQGYTQTVSKSQKPNDKYIHVYCIGEHKFGAIFYVAIITIDIGVTL